MSTMTLPLPPESNAARLPNLRSAIVEHWARSPRKARPARSEGTALVDHWAASAPEIKPAAAREKVADAPAAMVAADPWNALARAYVEATGKRSQVLTDAPAAHDPWLAIGRAYQRAVVEEQAVTRSLANRFQAWRQKRAQARLENEIHALAGGDERLLRDLQVARDLAEWR